MNTLFALVISVCALTGECSDVLIGVYPSEASCNSNADEQSTEAVPPLPKCTKHG
ncbi:DUF1482 family protein [Klebsiella pneumoniae]|uniref:DUF1482 family protein n=1 Tax=Klebsiella pneumoniae TaxID=573 RepID=UPI001D0D8C26